MVKEYAPTEAVLLDIDGTLLDSNEAHAQAWAEVFARHGLAPGVAQIRPLIGKGSDKLLAELLGIDHESEQGRQLGDERRALFLERLLPALQPTPGARELVQKLREEGVQVVIATSAGGPELDALLKQARIDDLIEQATTSDDAEQSKPDPDIVQAALARAGVQPVQAMMIGDTPWDVAAAAAAGVDTIALRCGGHWDDAALAGAVARYDDPAALVRDWEHTPICRRRMPAG